MNSFRQFSSEFFFLSKQQTKSSNVIDGLRERGEESDCTTREVFKVFEKKKISIELILNAALSAACLLPPLKSACRGGAGRGRGQGRVTTIL